ncbi:MAG: M14 family zinc carboxypeptidase [Candidatus Zipacnadales bacterium]
MTKRLSTLLLQYGLFLALGGANAAASQPNVIDQVLARCGEAIYSPEAMIQALAQLDLSDRVWVTSIGRSRQGRPIPLVALYHPQTVYGQTARLFIIARQHGNEVAGTEAMMAIIWHLAQSNQPSDLELLRRVTFAIIPMVNPDGAAAHCRDNSAGVDLNRDWLALTQPETLAVEWAFNVWRPHVFIDCHELPATAPKKAYEQSFVETIAEDPVLDPNMTRLCSFLADNVRRYQTAYGARLSVYYDSHGSDRRLAHRHFGLDRNTPSFLFESKTGAGYSMRDRIRFHVVGTLVIANLLAQRVAAPPAEVPVRPTIPMPQAPTVPPAQRMHFAAQTTVRFISPTADRLRFSEKIPLKIKIQPSKEFAYLSLYIDGVMRAITDAPVYESDLAVDTFENGTHTIICRAHDGSGRVLAAAERLVVVNNLVAGP